MTSWRPDALILNWRDVRGETGYRIERQVDASAGTWTTVGNVGVNVPSYTVTGLAAGTSYRFRVTATHASGDSVPAEAVGGTRLPAVGSLVFTTRESNKLAMSWTTVGGAANYRVQRSLNGLDFDTVATLPAGSTSYEDNTVQPLREYYYRVVATNAASQGLLGTTLLTATPAAVPLPTPWADRDIGAVRGAGATGFAGGTFTVLGGGPDIWAEADGFHYTYQPLVGDGEIVARVATQEYTGGWAKAGVMVRESLTAGSRHAMMVVTPDNGTAFQHRTGTGEPTDNNNTGGAFAPYWVRLVRQGNTLIGYRSANGTSWTEQARATFAMNRAAYVGLAVTPGDDGKLGSVTFTNVTVSNRAPTLSTAAAASPAVVTSQTTALSVAAADDHGDANNLRYTWSVVQAPEGGAAPTYSAQGVNAAKNVTATFYKAGSYVLRVTVTDAGGLSVTSDVAVQVVATATSLRVTPAGPVADAGSTVQFAAAVLDQFGAPVLPAPEVLWEASDGTITPAGAYAVPAAPGEYYVGAQAGGMFEMITLTALAVDATPPVLLSAASRKVHGAMGTFDLPLVLDAAVRPTVEPRQGGAASLRFVSSERLLAGDGIIDASEFALAGATFYSAAFEGAGAGPFVLTLNLAGLTDGGVVSVTLRNLYDAAGNELAGDVDVSVRSLFGDVNGSGRVDALDTLLVRSALYSRSSAWQYLLDVDASGSVNAIDFYHVRRNSARFFASIL